MLLLDPEGESAIGLCRFGNLKMFYFGTYFVGFFFFLKFLMLLLSKKINGIGTDLVGSCVAHWRLNFT